MRICALTTHKLPKAEFDRQGALLTLASYTLYTFFQKLIQRAGSLWPLDMLFSSWFASTIPPEKTTTIATKHLPLLCMSLERLGA